MLIQTNVRPALKRTLKHHPSRRIETFHHMSQITHNPLICYSSYEVFSIHLGQVKHHTLFAHHKIYYMYRLQYNIVFNTIYYHHNNLSPFYYNNLSPT